MRLCVHCGLMKDESSDFYAGKLYPSSRCKDCEKIRAKKTAKTRHDDPVKGPKIRQRRIERNKLPEVIVKNRVNDKLRHVRDSHKRKPRSAKYFQNNKRAVYDRVNARIAAFAHLRLRKSVSNAVAVSLKENGGRKDGRSVLKFLPYSMMELRAHLESLWEPWMNWSNHGTWSAERKTWQIDHILSQSSLPYDDFSHPNFVKCWALENLRPLGSIENLKKGSKSL